MTVMRELFLQQPVLVDSWLMMGLVVAQLQKDRHWSDLETSNNISSEETSRQPNKGSREFCKNAKNKLCSSSLTSVVYL